MFSGPLGRTRPLRADLLGSFGLAERTLGSRHPAACPESRLDIE